MINFIKKRKREMSGFTRLVDFGDAILSRTKSASPKLTTGFTLVETLVALFIFSISILTVMSALSRGISSTIYAKDKIVAEYLSQEGIEYFRNIRDTTMLYAPDKVESWKKFTEQLNNSCGTGCYFENNENNFSVPLTIGIITSCGGGECPHFGYDSSSGKYIQNGGSGNTTFSRKMWVEQAPNGESMKIISEVTFSAGSSIGTVSLSENLSDWIE